MFFPFKLFLLRLIRLIRQLRVLCQKQTEEALVCPLLNPVSSHREEAYTEIIDLASQFRAIGVAPHPDLKLPDEKTMKKNHASWHKYCHQLYSASALNYWKNFLAKNCNKTEKGDQACK